MKVLNGAKYNRENNNFTVYATPKSDYGVNQENVEMTNNAPFVYEEVTGDFKARAKVSHDFVSVYDACALFAYSGDKQWIKACFEYTDINSYSVVSVVNNPISDDCNGVNITGKVVWLQLSRKNNVFAIHYSTDGENYLMHRICNVDMPETIKVGMIAQSPLGEGGERVFEGYELKKITLDNIRMGR